MGRDVGSVGEGGKGDVRQRACAIVERELEGAIRDAAEIELVATARSTRDLFAAEQLPGGASVLIVSDACGDGVPTLARAVARWAPYAAVFLLVSDPARVLDLHAEYLAIAASDPRCDPRARVHLITGPVTATRLRRVLGRDVPARAALPPATDDVAPGTDEDWRPRYAALRRPGARTVLVQACCGGAGATTVSRLLAGAWVRRDPTRKVCIVELHGPGRPLPNVASQPPLFDPQLGVHVLASAVNEPSGVDLADAALRLIGTLRDRFDIVIADCDSSWPVTPMMERTADSVLFVTTVARASLAELERRAAAAAGHHGGAMRGVVVNGALNGVGVDPRDVLEAAHGTPIAVAVPFAAREVLVAANTGRLGELLDHPDLGPVYRRLAEHCLPPAELPVRTFAVIRPSRGIRRRRAAPPTGVSSPFVVEPGDGRAAG